MKSIRYINFIRQTNEWLTLLLIFAALTLISSCSGGGTPQQTAGGGGGGGGGTTNASLTLALSQATVQTDNADSATITATVLDAANVPVEGESISFATTGGMITASSADTDANGEAIIELKSGPIKVNQTVTVTASCTTAGTQTIPIQIAGTSLTLAATKTSIGVGETTQLTVTVRDAANLPVYNAPITVISSGTGSVTLSPAMDPITGYNGYTDVTGNLVIDVTGSAVGSLTLQATGLGTIASQVFSVAGAGQSFGITAPTTDTVSLSTGTDLTVTVNAPGVTNVQFISTIANSTWNGATNIETVPVVGGIASATFNSPDAGAANISVYDAAAPSTQDTLVINLSAPPADAAQLLLQASTTVVAPSTGDNRNTVTLTASVLTASGQVVGNAPVYFSFINTPPGHGEYISPVLVFTNDNGVAVSTFYAGSSTDSDGVDIQAEVVNTAFNDSVNIIVGGAAGSVVIGQSTRILANATNTIYKAPMSVQVSDSNGNSVANAEVSLKVWPISYYLGYWDHSTSTPVPVTQFWTIGEDINPTNGILDGFEDINCNGILDAGEDLNTNGILDFGEDTNMNCVFDTGPYAQPNEDVNRNLILDAGEDVGPMGVPDGALSPLNSSGGTLPATVITGDDGSADFELVYLKTYAYWIGVEVTASVQVYGSEASSSLGFRLHYMVGDEPFLGDSPFGWY